MQKKYISMLLVFLLLAVPFGTALAENSPTLLFELDLSTYNEISKTGLKNTVNPSTAFSVNGNPMPGSFMSANGETRYLTFATGRDTSRQATVFATEDSVLNREELTLEMWAKGFISNEGGTNGRAGCTGKFFAISTGTATPAVSMEMMVYNGLFFFRPAKKTATALLEKQYSMTQYNEQWTHFVFTRKWNADTSAWEYQTYANGVRLAAGSGQADGVFPDETGMKLCIGGNGETLCGMQGSLSTFKVYSGILAEEEIRAAYDAQKLSYTQLPAGLEVESISPDPLSETLDCNPGEITLQLSNYVDASLAKETISLKASDGTPVKGGIVISPATGMQKELKIRYGRLIPGEQYVLFIDGLESINGYSLSHEAHYQSYHDYELIFSEDFEDDEYIVDQPAPTAAGLTMVSNGIADDSSGIIVRETEDGDKYLELTALVGTTTTVTKEFSPISGGETVMELVVRSDSKRGGGHRGTAPRTMGNILTDADSVILAKADTGGANAVYGYIAGGNLETGSDFYYQSLKLNDDFHRMKYLIKKADNKFSYSAENMDIPEGWLYDGNLLSGGNETAFHAVELGNINTVSEDQATDCIQISSIKLYRVFNPGILTSNLSTLQPENNQVEIVFNDDMKADCFTEECVKMLDVKTGKRVELKDLSYDSDNRKLVLELADYPDYNRQYEVSFVSVENERGEAMKAEEKLVALTPSYCLTVDDSAGILQVKNHSGDIKQIKCFFVTHDTTGRIQNILPFETSVGANQTVTMPDYQQNGDWYLWDVTDGLNLPLLTEAVSIGS